MMASGNVQGPNAPRNRPNNQLSNTTFLGSRRDPEGRRESTDLKNANQRATNQKPANAEKEKEEKESEEEWNRFRKIYAFFLFMLILYECRPDRKNSELSNIRSVIEERFTQENYQSVFDRVIKMISPAMIDNKGLRDGDGNFQLKIKMAMMKMYHVASFLEMYNKLCEGDATIRDNKTFFMTFMDLIHFGEGPKNPNPIPSLTYLISMGSQVPPSPSSQSQSQPSSNGTNSGSLLGSVMGGIQQAINKGSALVNSIQVPGDSLTNEEKIALAPIGEKLRNIAAYFTTNQIYTTFDQSKPIAMATPSVNLPTATPPSANVAATPPQANVAATPPQANVAATPPQANVSSSNVPTATVPAIPPPATPVMGGGKKRRSHKNRSLSSSSSSNSGKKVLSESSHKSNSLKALWALG